MTERFILTHAGSGRRATVSLRGLVLEGDPEICRQLQLFLREPVLALRGSLDPQTGERGTCLRQLAVGSGEWLDECLSRAAVALGLLCAPDLR